MKRICLGCAKVIEMGHRRCPACQAECARAHPQRKTAPQRKLRREVLTRDGFTCQQCGRRLPASELECDHYPIPYAQDGPDHPENARTLCRECHRGVPVRWTFKDGPTAA